jgi:hypothetical protein
MIDEIGSDPKYQFDLFDMGANERKQKEIADTLKRKAEEEEKKAKQEVKKLACEALGMKEPEKAALTVPEDAHELYGSLTEEEMKTQEIY